MAEHDPATGAMRTLRFREYGDPGDVLRLETVPVPDPGPGSSSVVPAPDRIGVLGATASALGGEVR